MPYRLQRTDYDLPGLDGQQLHSLPKGFHPVPPDHVASVLRRLELYVPLVLEYREGRWDNGYIRPITFWYDELAREGIAMWFTWGSGKYEIHAAYVGCEHQWNRTLFKTTQQRMCYWEGVCTVCDLREVIDSSD